MLSPETCTYVGTEKHVSASGACTCTCLIGRLRHIREIVAFRSFVMPAAAPPAVYKPAPGEEPPPLYKPELIEPKKRLTLMQRCYKEPWVPIGAPLPPYITCPQSEHVRCSRATCAGCLTTAGVLSVGFGAFIAGNKVLAQYMMRARVAAQGATVVAMVVSAGGLFMPSKAEAQGAPRL